MSNWYVYIVQGSDGSLYTGITTNVDRRVSEHNLGMGAKSLRGKRPVTLVYFEKSQGQSSARKREVTIKSWRREYKLKLIERGRIFQ